MINGFVSCNMFFVDLPEIQQAATPYRRCRLRPSRLIRSFRGVGAGKKSSLAQNVTFITSRNSNFWHNLFGLKIAPAIFKSALLPRRSSGGAFSQAITP